VIFTSGRPCHSAAQSIEFRKTYDEQSFLRREVIIKAGTAKFAIVKFCKFSYRPGHVARSQPFRRDFSVGISDNGGLKKDASVLVQTTISDQGRKQA
jgi:hypothetical protein